jgi:hypothetical protein
LVRLALQEPLALLVPQVKLGLKLQIEQITTTTVL